MSWNGPINGDYSNVDFTKAPWASGIMTLSHEECIHVITNCDRIASGYVQENSWDPENPDSTYIINKYNSGSNWEKAINGDTYDVLVSYDPLVNTLGINESGIIQEPIEETLPSEVE